MRGAIGFLFMMAGGILIHWGLWIRHGKVRGQAAYDAYVKIVQRGAAIHAAGGSL